MSADVADSGRPEPVEPSVNPMDALFEGSPGMLADSSVTEAACGEDGRTAMLPGAPGSVAGAGDARAPGQESLMDLVHRLRTPLNAALLWVRLVRSGVLEFHSTGRALETIQQN